VHGGVSGTHYNNYECTEESPASSSRVATANNINKRPEQSPATTRGTRSVSTGAETMDYRSGFTESHSTKRCKLNPHFDCGGSPAIRLPETKKHAPEAIRGDIAIILQTAGEHRSAKTGTTTAVDFLN
jgi:hypothetical protein